LVLRSVTSCAFFVAASLYNDHTYHVDFIDKGSTLRSLVQVASLVMPKPLAVVGLP
jgi:hypothetical protein